MFLQGGLSCASQPRLRSHALLERDDGVKWAATHGRHKRAADWQQDEGDLNGQREQVAGGGSVDTHIIVQHKRR